jgi:4-hydroxy-tetrahydrodipicolinate synthase
MPMQPLTGVYNILATPVTRDGELDIASLRRLIDATVGMGVTGITILGVVGEAQKQTDAQRSEVLRVAMEVNQGRVPIIVGTSRDSTPATIAASREALAAGASGLMIAPPTFLQPGPGLTGHYRTVGEAVDLPIVLQDYPVVNGVTMAPRAMADLANTVPSIVTIKLEDVPTPQRTAQTLAMIDRDVSVLGGLGGVYLLDELRRGSAGTMTGFAYPEILVEIVSAWRGGDRETAAQTYYKYLPLLVFEGQPKLGLAIRKEILRRRGLIEHADVIKPGPTLDAGTAADLTETMAAMDLARYDLTANQAQTGAV